jgi:hypothetical protein
MGGPIRAYVAGFDADTHRVYYYLEFHDESCATPQVWYFDLDGPHPATARRALALEGPDDPRKNGRTGISDAWRAFAPGLIPLQGRHGFDLAVSLKAATAKTDTVHGYDNRFEGDLTLEAAGLGGDLQMLMFSDPLIRVQGVYDLPGWDAALVLVSYKGREYGHEEVAVPVLVTARELLRGTGAARSSVMDLGEPLPGPERAPSIVEVRDRFQPITWCATARNTTLQYDEDASFDVEFYFGTGDDGTRYAFIRTRYQDRSTADRPARLMFYEKVRLADSHGHTVNVSAQYPEKRVDRTPAGVEEWSEDLLLEWQNWLTLADSDSVRASFEGLQRFEFDLTAEQILALREIAARYREE